VDPSLRLAVELPPVPAGRATAPAALDPWWQTVLASVRAGAGVVWFTGGASAGRPAGQGLAGLACDACTMAAAAVALEEVALLGVVSTLPEDRHPAVLARDVTTLDVASGGRAAVLLRWAWNGPSEQRDTGTSEGLPGGPSAACAYLGEAVAVCRSVLQDDDPVFEGTYLRVAGAVNRPRPRRPGGPPLLVEVPAGAAALAWRESGPGFLVRQASSAAAAIVCADDPGEIELWRAFAEESTVSLRTGSGPDQVPDVVCRATLGHAWADTARRRRRAPTLTGSEPGSGSSSLFGLRSRLDAARAAGAGGVIVRVPPGRREDGTLRLEPVDAQRLAAELAECFEPWRR
jgi:alkanesulfonate monooxygenase SsuD/methylene tetrahydromethanopterin reductase-like flavin-dependent oxidoreductase (luciferase family)